MIKASVLIAVYNKERIVKRTLTALSGQSCQCFEVIICDDGSGPGMASMLGEMKPLFENRLKHVRQKDAGFRKCRILNTGALAAQSNYIIVLDPDCIPHTHFVRTHIREREKGRYLSGRRVELGEKITQSVMADTLSIKRLSNPASFLWQMARFKKNRHWAAGIYLPEFLRKQMNDLPLKLKGCNMSFWKADLVSINGFDELFETPGGGEDTDLERRFILKGLKSRNIKHGAVCYHLYHKKLQRNPVAKELYLKLEKKGVKYAVKGLSQRSQSNAV